MPGPSSERGRQAEATARRYLERHGLRTLASNFRSRWGEIDLVMEDRRQVVFVEVRYRLNDNFGGAAASVTPPKQARLVRAAARFLEQRNLAHRDVRFDIVAIQGRRERIEWLKDAFRPAD